MFLLMLIGALFFVALGFAFGAVGMYLALRINGYVKYD